MQTIGQFPGGGIAGTGPGSQHDDKITNRYAKLKVTIINTKSLFHHLVSKQERNLDTSAQFLTNLYRSWTTPRMTGPSPSSIK